MDVSLTPEQQEWQAATSRLAEAYAVTSADFVGAVDVEAGWSAVLDLGVPALRSPELAGVDAAGVESMLAVEAAARHLSTLPVVGQAVIVPELLQAAGASEALHAVVTGELRLAPAFSTDLADFATAGAPAVAFDAAGATHALLLRRHGEEVSLVTVQLDSTVDEALDLTRRLVPIAADAVGADLDLGQRISPDRLERAGAVAMTSLAADLLGVMDAAVVDAVQYAKDRRQFDTPIGSFQAVQHLLADAVVAVEGARSCVWHAAWSSDHESTPEAVLAARTAKAYCSAAGVRVVETTVQVFGGIAITWEHPSHLRLRRAHLDRQCLGAEDVHYRAIGTSRLEMHEVA